LAAGTVRNTISSTCLTFRETVNLTHPKMRIFNLISFYNNFTDHTQTTIPNKKQQKAIPLCVIAEIAKQKDTKLQQAIGQLTTLAIFFAMGSCEYLKVTQSEKRQTEILRLRILRFFKDGKLVEHDDPHLEFSDCISITFEMQKKDKKNDTITQMASGDVNMCPV
jgi:hypothetical protein